MFALLLTLSIIGVIVQEVARKEYNKKIKSGAFTFSALSVLCSLIVFLIISKGKFNFSSQFIPYSISFAVFYSAATVGTFLAISTGPLSITGLICKYSLLLPSIYGILFLDEPTGPLLYIGLGLLVVSLFLINYKGKGNDKKLSLKWAIFMLIAFFGNGGCSTVQKVQQIKFDGAGKNEFMIIALLISFVVMLVIALVFERENITKKITAGVHWYTICGLANGVLNLFVMMLAVWPASVVFPIMSAGGILLTTTIGVTVYKEKLTVTEIIGMVLGTVSIILLNL